MLTHPNREGVGLFSVSCQKRGGKREKKLLTSFTKSPLDFIPPLLSHRDQKMPNLFLFSPSLLHFCFPHSSFCSVCTAKCRETTYQRQTATTTTLPFIHSSPPATRQTEETTANQRELIFLALHISQFATEKKGKPRDVSIAHIIREPRSLSSLFGRRGT